MKIITGVCDGKKYKLSLTKNRLTQRKNKHIFTQFFVMLREFKTSRSSEDYLGFHFFAKLRTQSAPGDLHDPQSYTGYRDVRLDDERRQIGCTTFGKRAWKQIKAAIAAAK